MGIRDDIRAYDFSEFHDCVTNFEKQLELYRETIPTLSRTMPTSFSVPVSSRAVSGSKTSTRVTWLPAKKNRVAKKREHPYTPPARDKPALERQHAAVLELAKDYTSIKAPLWAFGSGDYVEAA